MAFDDTRHRYLAATLETHGDGRTSAAFDASDDGQTWRGIATAPGARTSQAEAAASGDTMALLVGRYAPDDRRSHVLVSRDAGATWTLSPLPGAREAECVTKVVVGASAMLAIGGCHGDLVRVARR